MEYTFNTREIILIVTIVILVIAILSQVKLEFRFGEKKDHSDKKDIEKLTQTEYKILNSISEGKSNQELADEFNISISTVKKHISNIFKKLKIKKRSEVRKFSEQLK